MKLPIILETNNFIIADKPAGLLSIPDRYNEQLPSVFRKLKRRYEEIFVVHRLDRATSGLILFAKNAAAHKHLSIQFENRKVDKIYTGIVLGKMTELHGLIDAPLMENPHHKGQMMVHKRGKPSQTEFAVTETFAGYSVVDFKLLTGRTHQIRVHARHIHHPLVCDPVYGDGRPFLLSAIKRGYRLSKDELAEQPLLSRLALHARALTFEDIDGNTVSVDAPLPRDMNAVVKQLRKVSS